MPPKIERREFIRLSLAGAVLSLLPVQRAFAGDSGLRGYIRTNWSEDPFAFGSYSFFAKGSERSDRQALVKPMGDRVFFAGEACHPKYNGTVHSAYESGRSAAKAIAAKEYKKVAIIGAGMSGLAAAHALDLDGIEVVVFEARDRLGGRVWTSDQLGMPLDLGASWIHGTRGNPLFDLSDQVKLPRFKTSDDYVIRGSEGQKIRYRDAPGWLRDVCEIEHLFGAETDSINMDAYYPWRDYGGPDVAFRSGYKEIFKTLNGDYSVQLDTHVTEIQHSETDALLRFESSVEKTYDAVLVTVPLGVLKAGVILFSPPLPERKQRAIERLGMGVLDKVYLLFDEPFWDQETTWILTPENGLPRGQFNQWLNFYPYINEPVIQAFNAADSARELSKLSDEDVLKRALQTLRMVYDR